MKVRVKFGDSASHRSRDIRLPHFVTNDNDDNDAGVRRSSHKGKKPSQMPLTTVSGRISRERLKRGSRNFTRISGTTGPTKLLVQTSLFPLGCKMQLNTVQKCVKRVRRLKSRIILPQFST